MLKNIIGFHLFFLLLAPNLCFGVGGKFNIGIKTGITVATTLPSQQYSVHGQIKPYLGAALDIKLDEHLIFKTGLTYNRLNNDVIALHGFKGLFEFKEFFYVRSALIQMPLNMQWKILKLKVLPLSLWGITGFNVGYNNINSYYHSSYLTMFRNRSTLNYDSHEGIITNERLSFLNYYLDAGFTVRYAKPGKRIFDINFLYSFTLNTPLTLNYKIKNLKYNIPQEDVADPSAVSSLGTIEKLEGDLSPRVNLIQFGITWFIFK